MAVTAMWTARESGDRAPLPPVPHDVFRNAMAFPFIRNVRPWGDDHAGAIVLVQVRDDGRLGAWGGGVEKGETFGDALHRELWEEAGCASGGWNLEAVLHVRHHRAQEHNYFYTKELSTLGELHMFESGVITAQDWGSEVAGLRRVFIPDQRCRLPKHLRASLTRVLDSPWEPVALSCFKMLLNNLAHTTDTIHLHHHQW